MASLTLAAVCVRTLLEHALAGEGAVGVEVVVRRADTFQVTATWCGFWVQQALARYLDGSVWYVDSGE